MKKTIKSKEIKNLPNGKVLYILRFADGTKAVTFQKEELFEKVKANKTYNFILFKNKIVGFTEW